MAKVESDRHVQNLDQTPAFAAA